MKRKLPFYFWLIAITLASLMPSGALPDKVPLPLGTDKAVHIVMYTILTLLACVAFMRAGHGTPYRRILAIAGGIISYGILIEILQPLISTRSFEWTDILANIAGVLGGSLLWEKQPHLLRAPEASTTEHTESPPKARQER